MDICTYPVVETFHSLQGEGAWMGVNAFFIRLGGCDVHCPFCDTKESWPMDWHQRYSVGDLVTLVSTAAPAIVVITGGEPWLHNLYPLTDALHKIAHNGSMPVHIETSGAHPKSGDFDWITLSPKKFIPPHVSAYSQVEELKIVVSDDSDLEWAEEQASLVPASTLKYLQPEWSRPETQNLIFDYILGHPQWRMSLQTHKFLGVR